MPERELHIDPSIVSDLISSIHHAGSIRHLSPTHLPNRTTIVGLLDELRSLIFPGFFGSRDITSENLEAHVEQMTARLAKDLAQQVQASLVYMDELGGRDGIDERQRSVEITMAFLRRLSAVRHLLDGDVQAAYRGDPAATHTDEIIFCYPGITALMVHRVAHELYKLGAGLLARIMSEQAHSITGIDIHPGARIGERFFIDHGTGVVIGETTVIGHDCTVYQGVTLGSKNFPTDASGAIIRGNKRHPTLGNRVTVYASATILGGDTKVGDDCVIGGGVFLTRSVPAGHVVRAGRPEQRQKAAQESGLFEWDGSGI